MTDLIFFSLSCIGLTFILKYGSILAFLRERLTRYGFFRELFSCALCLGFWSGLITGGIHQQYNILMCAPYGAAISWVADFYIDLLISKIKS